jgi:hypothetical protein
MSRIWNSNEGNAVLHAMTRTGTYLGHPTLSVARETTKDHTLQPRTSGELLLNNLC